MAKTKTNSTARQTPAACPPKPALGDRTLLSNGQARRLAGVFKVLANDTRLRLLHALAREQELCVNDLSAAVQMKPQAVSNQLQRLVAQGIINSRPDGNQVFYRIVDPCVTALLDHGWCLAEDSAARKP